MSRSDRVSAALHAELARILDDEPIFVVQRALRNVPRIRENSHGGARTLVDRWETMLHEFDISALRATMLADTEDAREMRNSSVFTGIIDEHRRMSIVQRALIAA